MGSLKFENPEQAREIARGNDSDQLPVVHHEGSRHGPIGGDANEFGHRCVRGDNRYLGDRDREITDGGARVDRGTSARVMSPTIS